jgi:hypothetical protein
MWTYLPCGHYAPRKDLAMERRRLSPELGAAIHVLRMEWPLEWPLERPMPTGSMRANRQKVPENFSVGVVGFLVSCKQVYTKGIDILYSSNCINFHIQ